jgi:hypothetical protein
MFKRTPVGIMFLSMARATVASTQFVLRVLAFGLLGLVVLSCDSERCPEVGLVAVDLRVQDAGTLIDLCDAMVTFVAPSDPSTSHTLRLLARYPDSEPVVCFWAVPGLGEGEYRVRVSVSGYRSEEAVFDIQSSDDGCFLERVDFVFRLERE